MKRILLLVALVFSMMHGAFAAEKLENYGISMMLPIDWSAKKHYDLSVKIPKGYESIQPITSWENEPLIEFIPKGEDHFLWSEIITVQRIVGRKVTADQVANAVKNGILSAARSNAVLVDQKTKDKYPSAFFVISYTHNGKKEIIGAKYLSGPYDCAGVQYTIRPTQEQTEEGAVQKIKAFFEENVTVAVGSG